MPAAVDSMFSAKLVPWHGLGYISDRALSLEEALTAAGLDWQVLKVPSVIRLDGEVIDVQGRFDLVRQDTKKSFAQVTESYSVVQNREVGEFVSMITGDDDAQFETAGALQEGQRIWFLCNLKKDLYVAGDKIEPYFLISNNHDGKGGLLATCSAVRVVCQNTLNMALQGARRVVSVRHTGDMEARVAEKTKVLNLTKKYYETFEEFATKLVAKKVSETQIKALVNDVLFPIKEGAAPRGETRTKNARETLLNCLAKPDLANIKDTAWGVYNAVADFSDFERTINGAEKNERAARERGFVRTFEGTDLKDTALAFLASI